MPKAKFKNNVWTIYSCMSNEVIFKGKSLCGADLCNADLRGTNLCGADLCGADLYAADLCNADLCNADLCNADLRYAYLRGAYLCGANLCDADLCNADLRAADLRGAKGLSKLQIAMTQICPSEGPFIAFKKTTKGVIKIQIPEDAERCNGIGSRKCRASKIIVIDGDGVGGTGPNHKGLIYEAGRTIEADRFDNDVNKACTNGIHFFMTYEEALDW